MLRKEMASQMRKAGVLFIVVTLVILLYCAGSGTAAAGMQAERARSVKPQVSQVSSGSAFTAAVKADGTLWTWGYDQRAAQFGINTFRPGQVGSDTNWSTVSAGGNQVSAVIAALKTDGTLWTWSWPAHWGLWGLEMHLRGPIAPMLPAQVGKDRDWAAVSVGGAHIAALKKDGTLWTWGANQHGQLGDGTTVPRSEPVQVGKDRDWVSVSAGGNHTAALKKDGTLWTWGWNMCGQLGIGTGGDPRAFALATLPPTYADEHLPVQVGKDRDWAAVFAGSAFTAAIKADGTLWAWGMHGIAMPGVNRVQVRPLRVGRDTDWASVSLGYEYAGYATLNEHAAALKKDGTLWTWGSNQYGQLGDGTTVPRTVPAQVGKDRDWAAVSVRGAHTAALKSDGTLWTWGSNSHGELGEGTLPVGDGARYSPFRNAPAPVSLAPDNSAEARPGAPKMVRLYSWGPWWRTNDVPTTLGGEPVPFTENGRTMVPLRFLGEQLGAVVRFDSAKKEVTVTKGTVTVQLRLGDKAARISQEGAVLRTVALDVPARAMHGRTVVPLRFVSEALGATVIWTEDGGIFVLQ
jgi:alpha-tubulin suppressor-like RCC1 family protein